MSEENQKKSRLSRIVQILILALILIGFPAGSWFYLKKGAEYRRANISELGDLGKFEPQGTFLNVEMMPASADSLRGKMLLIAAAQQSDDFENPRFIKQFSELDEQYKNREDTRLLLLTGDSLQSRPGWVSEKSAWVFFAPAGLNEKAFGLDFGDTKPPCWVLVDAKGSIRKYYQADEFEKLVLQSSMIAPGKQRESIELKREKEK